MTDVDQRSKALTRRETGGTFESELALVQRVYEFEKVGRLRKQHPPFKKLKEGWTPIGSAGVDYAGHVCVKIVRDSGPFGRDSGVRYERCPINNHSAARRVFPVAFDAKVIGLEHVTYHHEKKMQHQLHTLREEASAGVSAFLLVWARQVERVFLISIENHFEQLLSGGVTLYEKTRKPFGASDIFPLLPSCERSKEPGPTFGMFDWIPLLQWCPSGYDEPSERLFSQIAPIGSKTPSM